jgi:hypothetical protein
MNLPPKAIEEFQEMWHQQTGGVLDNKEAVVQAEALLQMLEAVFKPKSRGDPSHSLE